METVAEILDLLDLGLSKEATDELTAKRQKELDMWRTWKSEGMQQQHLRPLLTSLRPLIRKQSNQWAIQRDVPPAAIHAEFLNHAVKALETYDPARSGLQTYLTYAMKKAPRFIKAYQNAAYIPETRSYSIQKFKDANTNLEDHLGRAPTQLEIADHMKWSPKKVAVMQREVNSIDSDPSGRAAYDPSEFMPSRQAETLRLLPYDLTPEECSVFEHLYGVGGKPKLSPGDISRKLGMSAPKVSRVKAAIAAKYDRYR
jgi:DNA-directed RNA polymerase specialized sigma subunit